MGAGTSSMYTSMASSQPEYSLPIQSPGRLEIKKFRIALHRYNLGLSVGPSLINKYLLYKYIYLFIGDVHIFV